MYNGLSCITNKEKDKELVDLIVRMYIAEAAHDLKLAKGS